MQLAAWRRANRERWDRWSDLARGVIARGVLAVSLATLAVVVSTAPVAASEPLSTTLDSTTLDSAVSTAETTTQPVVETTDATLHTTVSTAETTTEPVVETTDATLDTTVSTAEATTEPVVETTDATLDTTASTLEPIADAVEPVLEPIAGTVEPIADAVEPVLEPIAGTVEPVLATVNIGEPVDAAPPTAMLLVGHIDYASPDVASRSSRRDPARAGVSVVAQTHLAGDPTATSVILGEGALITRAAGTSASTHAVVPTTSSPSLTLDGSAVAAALTAAIALLGLLGAGFYSTTYLLPTGRRAFVPVPPG